MKGIILREILIITTPADMNKLHLEIFGRGVAWLDAGTPESLQAAASYIETIEKRQGLKIACPEDIAYRLGFITADDVRRLAAPLRSSPYGKYLLQIIE